MDTDYFFSADWTPSPPRRGIWIDRDSDGFWLGVGLAWDWNFKGLTLDFWRWSLNVGWER